jgi:hypothetical protein
MKKTIYITGISCANLLMMGCMFKIQHWPGAGVLLVTSIFLFAFVFLPLALVNGYREPGQAMYKGLYIISYLVFSIIMLGALFKIMHWPGAGIFLLIGIPLPFVVFLPMYLYYTRKEKNTMGTNFTSLMFGLIFLAVFSVFLSLNISKNILTRMGENTLSLEYTKAIWFDNFNAESNTGKATSQFCEYIDKLKCSLLKATNNSSCINDKPVDAISVLNAINLDNNSIPKTMFSHSQQNNRTEELRQAINTYRTELLANAKGKTNLENLINDLLNTDDKFSEEENTYVLWPDREFGGFELIAVLDALTQLQTNAMLLQNELSLR